MLATTEGERPILIVRDAWLLDLGRRPYREVWEWQKSLVDRRADDRVPDGLILVEHEPIATLGRRGQREDVRPSVIAHFQGVFGFTLRRVDVSELLRERPADQKRRRP